VDIAKAFDSIARVFLLDVLQHMGFRMRWRNWISILLSSGSTRILLIGKPGLWVCHARGLWQGDPLVDVVRVDHGGAQLSPCLGGGTQLPYPIGRDTRCQGQPLR